MSMESANAFIERLKTDEAFGIQVAEYADKEALVQFAITNGFDFTAKELETAKSELSDNDIENLAGGRLRGGRHCLGANASRW